MVDTDEQREREASGWRRHLGPPPATDPPDPQGFRRVAHQKIPIGRLTKIAIFSTVPWTIVFLFSIALLGDITEVVFVVRLVDVLIALVLALIGVPLVHEAIHGLAARLLGARPSYGIGTSYAYTTFCEPVSRAGYLFIGLAPLVVMSAAGLAVVWLWQVFPGFTLIVLVANAVGSIGDLWISWRVLKLPANVRIYDLADSFAAYVPDQYGTFGQDQ